MIHILFGEEAAGSLKKAGLRNQAKILFFTDTFSIGPVWQLHDQKGLNERCEWLKSRISADYGEFPDCKLQAEKTIRQLYTIPEEVPVAIWCSDNAHEQTGLRYTIYLLKEKTNRITVVNTTEAYKKLFNVKKVDDTPLHTGEVPPEKLLMMWEQRTGHPLTDHERKKLGEEWLELAESGKTLRIWRNGRVRSVSDETYDEFIIQKARKLHGKQKPRKYMDASRLIGEVLRDLSQYTGGEFIEYRLRQLVNAGAFEAEGQLEAKELFCVKLL